MSVENLTARAAQFAATSLAAGAIGLALLTSPCPAQTALVTTGPAHPIRMENAVTTHATPRESARPIEADTIRPFEIHVLSMPSPR